MKEKFNSIKNKISYSFRNEKLRTFIKKTYNISVLTYQKVYNSITSCAKYLHDKKVSANFISIFGFVIGILALNFISLEMYGTALLCILINRWFDALDGAVANLAGSTKFGTFIDTVLDYMFYGAVIFGFALANPQQNAVAAAFLLFAFSSTICALLTYAIVNKKNEGSADTSIYLGGFAQGAEATIALIILCIVPSWFLEIAIVLGIYCLVKSFSIISTAFYNLVIVEKKNKK